MEKSNLAIKRNDVNDGCWHSANSETFIDTKSAFKQMYAVYCRSEDWGWHSKETLYSISPTLEEAEVINKQILTKCQKENGNGDYDSFSFSIYAINLGKPLFKFDGAFGGNIDSETATLIKSSNVEQWKE